MNNIDWLIGRRIVSSGLAGTRRDSLHRAMCIIASACAFAISCFPTTSVCAETLAELRFDTAETTGTCGPWLGSLKLWEDQMYKASCYGNVEPPYLLTQDEVSGDKVLDFITYHDVLTPENGVQRSEMALAQLGYDELYYIGFAMKMPAWSEPTSAHWSLFMQLWACAPLPPFVALRFKQGTSHTIQLVTRNDESDYAVVYEAYLHPETWHTFVLRVDIRPTSSGGTLKLWRDGSMVAWYGGNIGYDVHHCDYGSAPLPENGYRVKFGIYKQAEWAFQEVMFDEVRVATDFHEAKPW